MIKDGRNCDFAFKQMNDGKVMADSEKKMVSPVEIQVNAKDIDNEINDQFNIENIGIDKEAEEKNALNVFLPMLKKHAIDILTRMNPETKSYDGVEWEQTNFKKLLETRLDKVYKDTEMVKQNRGGDGGLTF